MRSIHRCMGSSAWRLPLILLLALGMLGPMTETAWTEEAGPGTETPVVPIESPTAMGPTIQPPTEIPTEAVAPTEALASPTVEPTTASPTPVATGTEPAEPDPTDPATPEPTATETPEDEDFVGSAGGTINVHARDGAGDPVLSTCIRLWKDGGGGTQGDYVSDTCDRLDGNNNGDITVQVAAAGNYVIGISVSTFGYFPAPDFAITMGSGQTLERTFVLPPGARFRLHAEDRDDNVLTGACFRLHEDFGNGEPYREVGGIVCDEADGLDGVVTLQVPFPGPFVAVETTAPTGYLKAENTLLSAQTAGQVVDADVPHDLVASVDVTLLDENGDPLIAGCFYAFQGDVPFAYRCDWDDGVGDGITRLTGLRAGEWVITGDALFYAVSSSDPFTLEPGETASITLTGQPWGTILIHKTKPNGDPLPDFCFNAISRAPDHRQYGGCDGNDQTMDATATFRAPPGTYDLQEILAPPGYVPAVAGPIEVEFGETVEITIVGPTPSTAIITAVDVSGNLVPGVCWSLIREPSEEYAGKACDTADGARDGKTTIPKLRGMTHRTRQERTPTGYLMAEPVSFSVGVMATAEVTVQIPQPAPKITKGPWLVALSQTSVMISWETDQKTSSLVDYGLTADLGRLRPKTQPAPSFTHLVELSPLVAGTLYRYRVLSENVNGEAVSATFSFRTHPAGATAAVTIRTTDVAGVLQSGACYNVYRDLGSGKLGAYAGLGCDQFDQSPTDGRTRIGGLTAGNYVLVETVAPGGLQLAANRSFSLTSGEQRTISVKNVAGGGSVAITARNENNARVLLTCYSIYTDAGGGTFGSFISYACDDYDATDGTTKISGLPIGAYLAWQEGFPSGHVRAQEVAFRITVAAPDKTLTMYTATDLAADSILLQTVSSSGALLTGACFSLYFAEGSPAGSACDSTDGRLDGRTFFTRAQPGDYSAVEYRAPDGFRVGRTFEFTKGSGQRKVNVTQVAGGTSLTITTLKGSTSARLTGACYVVYRLVTPTSGNLAAFACDGSDGAVDGITRITGLVAGSYVVQQTTIHAGYRSPTEQRVTIASSPKALTFRNQRI